ncbi:HlyD family efflux transporter periplasmic adaptor subunit [Fictibacillus sp. WQ 8-8]|uniref:HlyD family efflux transporter periplasmic adaptor subunit n=1 Tax=Fictibacillus marinisediminis TaxID=2878389 RepID=A0A9X2BBM7_9BACL|nr:MULTISPECIES: HlyD family efflux transporter periplasmic adaptor subunit [Fictibacillus]MCK6255581.1 HlyD family efflux transporter periplasmic adaptor subunit [Fictibacillus marinisediminis]MCQ6267589.1 HlyD family efflux transporter periplasmic adaptor subunit [Fictibacillus sp. WQ 8-8]
MSRGRLLMTNIIAFLVVIVLIAGGAYYYFQNNNYVSTDNAKVTGELHNITAPTDGKLSDWNLEEGKKVTKDDKIGKISGAEKSMSITTPADGTIIKKQANNDQMVQAGQTLASEVNMDELYVIANIKEDELKDIEEGDQVDVTVDGDDETTLDGNVEKIGFATNSLFSLMPKSNDDGNYTKVTQTVPVKISITNSSDKVLPGMNAEVKISKN